MSLFKLQSDKLSKTSNAMVIADSNISVRQLEIIEKDREATEFKKDELDMRYSKIVLGCILLCQIAN